MTSAEFSQLDTYNMILIKSVSLIFKLLKFYLDTFPELKNQFSSGFTHTVLDILRYSSQYISNLSFADFILQTDIIQEHGVMCQNICYVLSIITFNNQLNLLKSISEYGNFRDLLETCFINQKFENYQAYESQLSLKNFLFNLLHFLSQMPENNKQSFESIFKLIFVEIIFTVLQSNCMSIIILKFFSEVLSRYNLQRDFGWDINLTDTMKQLVFFIRFEDRTHYWEIKAEACYKVLYQYLNTEPSKLEYFGHDCGLIAEILEVGVFQTRNSTKDKNPKYKNNSLIKSSFDILLLLSRNKENFQLITNFLSQIHNKAVWRTSKDSSWSLTTQKMRGINQYAGLKNLGCSIIYYLI